MESRHVRDLLEGDIEDDDDGWDRTAAFGHESSCSEEGGADECSMQDPVEKIVEVPRPHLIEKRFAVPKIAVEEKSVKTEVPDATGSSSSTCMARDETNIDKNRVRITMADESSIFREFDRLSEDILSRQGLKLVNAAKAVPIRTGTERISVLLARMDNIDALTAPVKATRQALEYIVSIADALETHEDRRPEARSLGDKLQEAARRLGIVRTALGIALVANRNSSNDGASCAKDVERQLAKLDPNHRPETACSSNSSSTPMMDLNATSRDDLQALIQLRLQRRLQDAKSG